MSGPEVNEEIRESESGCSQQHFVVRFVVLIPEWSFAIPTRLLLWLDDFCYDLRNHGAKKEVTCSVLDYWIRLL